MSAVMILPVGILSQRVTGVLSASSRSLSRSVLSRTLKRSATPSPMPAPVAPITGSSATGKADSPSGDERTIFGDSFKTGPEPTPPVKVGDPAETESPVHAVAVEKESPSEAIPERLNLNLWHALAAVTVIPIIASIIYQLS